MKKIIITIFSILLLLGLTSCNLPFFQIGSKTETPTPTPTDIPTTESPVEVYTLTFISTYGTTPEPIKDINKIPTELPVLEQTGYTFEGWYYDLTYSNKVFAYDELKANTIIYAKWVQQTYNIIFNNNGHGNKVNPINGIVKLPTTLPTLGEDGFIFEGWYYDQTFTKLAKPNDTMTSNITLFAKWTVAKYNVTYIINNHGIQPDNLTELTNLPSVLPTLTDDNYNFLGWYYDQSFTKSANPNDKLTNNVTLYAKWEKKTYTISFIINNHGTQPENITETTRIPYSLPKLTENYYSFEGWYMDEEFTTPVESGSSISSNITLYAKWKKIAFNITFDNNGMGQTLNAIENVSKVPYSLEYLTHEGYQFLGWYYDEECKNIANKGDAITSDITLYAKWEIIPEPDPTYSITYNINGHGKQPTNLIEQSNLPNPLPTLTEIGYNFLGWYYDQSFTTEAYPGQYLTENVTLYARWQELFDITFNTNGHDDLNKIIGVTELPINLPELNDEGYNFLGWYLDSKFIVEAIPGSSINSDVTLYAKWQELYDITYNTNGHGIVDSLINVTELPNPLPTLRYNGYNFLGWYLEPEFITLAIPGSSINSDITLYAKWQELYNISYDTNGHGDIETDYEVLSLPNTLPTLTDDGYNFLGWYLDDEFLTKAIPGSSINSDVTLYAKWEIITYTISFNSNGYGTNPENITDTLIIPEYLPVLEYPGYNFIGWYYDEDCTVKANKDDKITRDITLYAKWEKAKYIISFNNNAIGNSLANVIDYKLPDPLPVLYEDGYIFAGWFYDSSFTDKAYANDEIISDTTLYANWIELSSKPSYTKFSTNGPITITNGLGVEQTFTYSTCPGFSGIYTNITGYDSKYSQVKVILSTTHTFKICLETYVNGSRTNTGYTTIEQGSNYEYIIDFEKEELNTSSSFRIFFYLDPNETELNVEKSITFHSFEFINPNNPNEGDYTPEASYNPTNQTYTVNYIESNETFANPDRGFYNAKVYTATTTSAGTINPSELYSNNLLHLRFDLGVFSTAAGGADMALTQSYLDSLKSMLQAIDDSGACAIVRFAYTYPSDVPEGTSLKVIANKEPSIDMMKTHISQFVPVLNEFTDVITALECGLVGPWGEMHSSDIATQSTWNILFDQFLSILDEKIKFVVRQPNFIYKYYGYTLDNLENFDYENCNRIGLFNDGYLGSKSDLGTFDDRKKEITFLEKLESFPYGGEVVKDSTPNDYNELWHSCNEMFRTNLSYLNIAWNDEVIERWANTPYGSKYPEILNDPLYQNKSEFDYINNHLGYRLVCEELNYKLTNKFTYSLDIKNVGFGGLYKEKTAFIILKNENELIKYEVNTYSSLLDDSFTLSGSIDISNLNGEYSVYLVLADNFTTTSIRGIRFANYFMYDEILQANKLTNIII